MRVLYLLRFLSVRYWLRHRGGFVLAALGVSLGIAVFVAIQVANYSVLRAFDASLDAVTGRANLQIEGGANELPEAVYTRLATRDDARLQAIAPNISRTLYSPSLQRSLLVQGIDPFAELSFRDLRPESGENGEDAGGVAAPVANDARGLSSDAATSSGEGLSTAPTRQGPFARLLTDPGAIAVSDSLAKRAKLRIGSPVELYLGAKKLRFHVAVILGGASTERAFGGDFAVVDISTAQEAFGLVGRVSSVSLRVPENEIEALRSELRPLLPPDARIERPSRRGAEVAGLLKAFQLNLSALSCIAVFVGAFLIYNAIAMAVVRRRHEVGIMRATGAPSSALTGMFLLEAAFIGTVGGVLGLGLGLLMARFALKAVATTVSQLYIAVRANTLFVPLWLPPAAVLGGAILATLAAIPAAREGARVSPREAISRVSGHRASEHIAPRLAALGVLVILLAGALCLPIISNRTLFAGFVAAFCTLTGFALLCPMVALLAGELVQRAGAHLGVETLLAGQYLRRAVGRSGLAVAALSVALAMSIGVSLMVRSFRETVAGWVNTTITADLYVTVANGFSSEAGPGLPPEVVSYAKSRPQVRVADTIRGAELSLRGKNGAPQPIFIGANEMPALQSGDRPMRFLNTRQGDTEAKRAFGRGTAILVSERFRNLIGPGAGDTLRLPTPRGIKTYSIAGVFADYTPDRCVLYMPKSLYVRDWNDFAVDGVGLYVQRGTDVAALRDDIERHFAGRYTLTLVPNGELRAEVFKTFDQTFAVTYALQLIAVVVAGIGVFDTLLALLLERGRELATLRALGASRAQVLRATAGEFAMIGFLAWIVGTLSGGVLALQLIFVINRQFFGWSIAPTLPMGPILGALLLSVGAAILSGAAPAWRAANRPLAELLQED